MKPLAGIICANFGFALLAACQATPIPSSTADIYTKSTSVYSEISENIGGAVCVIGEINTDHQVIKFPLEELEVDGVINVSFSRISTDLSPLDASDDRLNNGDVIKVCGFLKNESVQFKNCKNPNCGFFLLEGSRLVTQ